MQIGPMQDDEMLLIYAFIRVTRSARVLELGGQLGGSARNFLAATRGLPGATVYTVDLIRVRSQAANHVTLKQDATQLTAADVHNLPIDLVLLDCHHYNATIHTLRVLRSAGLIRANTTLALHDTGLHQVSRDPAHKRRPDVLRAQPGFVVHELVERLVVEDLRTVGIDGSGRERWAAIHAHRDVVAEGDVLQFRHGLTLMQLDRALDNELLRSYTGIGVDTGPGTGGASG
ncbi:hypothetical protein T492DRAFT_926320 [Pavlovales sp. CCMP2436]|nr:hypothetical protein T492DRAFT_926320 [Pavlovales sp. CCMP2436]